MYQGRYRNVDDETVIRLRAYCASIVIEFTGDESLLEQALIAAHLVMERRLGQK